MAGEGLPLSVSTATAVHPSSSAGPVGIGLSGLNAPIDALSAPRSPTESSEFDDPASESRLSPTGSDPSGSDDYDPGYTDNDALCATCRFLLEDPDLDSSDFEGWEVKFSKDFSGRGRQNKSYMCSLTTKMTWPGDLKSKLFDDKCPLCCELLCGISKEFDEFFQQHPTQDKITVVKSLEYTRPLQYFRVLLVVYDKDDQTGYDYKRAGSIKLYPERENELHDWLSQCQGGFEAQLLSDRAIGNPGPFESNTGSDLSWQLVRAWMAKCLSSHKTCNQMQSVAPPLPTTVIDVGSRGGKCPPRLHVVTGKESGRYATLSHRWGSQEMLKLEVKNLEDLKREIPWERLPNAFQDAIEATRRLGIRYIWIDSLCIIQDSPNGTDWAAESAKMTSVYENSYINFAAADAANSTQGCFFDRNPSSVRPVRLHIDWRWAVDLVEPGYYYAATSHRFRDNVAKAPLYRRGWVYQERTLAPRIIHCCAKQLYWECLESIASESFPMGLPHCIECTQESLCDCSKWQKIRPPASVINKYLDGSSPSSNKYFESLMLWNRVVVQYQTLDLTFERDKLVAISGLATMHSRFLNTRYLAGMWLEHLPMQLLWYRDWWADRVDRSYNEYIAPSWSYASIRGTVQPIIGHESYMPGQEKQFRPIIQILDATVDLVDENHPFGAVSGGALRLKGPLAKPSFIKNLAWDISREQFIEVIRYDDERVGQYILDEAVDYVLRELQSKKPWYFLPILLRWDLSLELEYAVSGLVIQETDCGENTFQRIGIFLVESHDKLGKKNEVGIRMLQEACRSQNGPDDDGPFPEWGMFQTITLI